MKRPLTFIVGICIFVAASAIGKSDNPNAINATAASDFGQVSVENLTAEQRAVLQKKFQHWSSSTYVSPKAPI